jgi:hypothetical protein
MIRDLTEAEQTALKDRWKSADGAYSEQITKELDDLRFESGEHWDEAVKQERDRSGKPCLTIDLLSGPTKQVLNQARSARPGIVVNPRGDGATQETAQLWQAILRRIETNSNADYAYTWASQHQVKMGRGYWRILPYYVAESSDEQDLKVCWIDNQHSVFLDPSAKEPDKSDARWAFVYDDLTMDDYKARFGESSVAAHNGLFGVGSSAPPDWLTKERVRIAEYFYIEESSRTRHTLSDGTYVWDDLLERGPRKRVKGKYTKGDPLLPEGQSIVRSREIPKRTVKWMLTNGVEVLAETTIPGRHIPIVEIVGERRNIGGKVDYRGLVRMAKDPQRQVNYMESASTESVGVGAKSRWLVADTQIADYQDMWATANRKNWDALVYSPQSVGGSMVPPPIPIDREPPIQATTMSAQRASMQLRAILGYVDVSMNEAGPEGAAASGRAINARKLQQEMQASDYMDNLGRGIRLTAKILYYMVRELYDTPRLLRIKGADDKERDIITHLGPEQQQQAMAMRTQAVQHVFDLQAGDYDFAFTAGKSYQSQQQEATDAMGQLFTAAPELAKVGADIWVRNMTWPGSYELAERLKKANPLAQDDKEQNIPPQVQQRLQALDQYAQMAHEQIQQLNQMISEKQAELDTKKLIAAAEIEAKKEIAAAQEETKRLIANLEVEKASALAMLEGQRAELEAARAHAHDIGMESMRAVHRAADTVRKEQERRKSITFKRGPDGAIEGATVEGEAPEAEGAEA